MKVHYDITQGTSEWHEIRFGKIGGTRSIGSFTDSDTLVNKLAAERTEMYVEDDSYLSNDMLRGQELEPVAKDNLQDYTGITFKDAGWIDSDIYGVGISPDGISECETIMCEIKCLNGANHVNICITNEVPKKHIHQVLHYFTCNPKLETMYFCSFRPESKVKPLFVKELNRDSKVDIGQTVKTKVKEDRGHGMKDYTVTIPELKTVREWVDISRNNLLKINTQVESVIETLKF